MEALLRQAMERGRKSFKRTLNEAVRRGLKGPDDPGEPAFVVKARPLGLRPGIDPAELRELDDELELREFRRKTKALEDRLA